MRTIPECQFGAAVALVQPESGTEMREDQYQYSHSEWEMWWFLHLERDRSRSCGAVPREPRCQCSPGSGLRSDSRGVGVSTEVVPGLVLSGVAQEGPLSVPLPLSPALGWAWELPPIPKRAPANFTPWLGLFQAALP